MDVAARFTDEAGKPHAYNLQGSFLFQPPRNLRIDLRPGLGEQVMQIGSNHDDYWIWIEPEEKSMRWGRHRHSGKPCTDHPGMRPDQLIGAMGVIDLPGPDAGLLGPGRRFGKTYDILEYWREQAGGGFLIEREYWIDRVEPFQVRVVLFRDEYGRKSMSALLDDYRPAWEGGPHVAHQVSVLWHQDDAAFTVWMTKVTGIPAADVSSRAFLRPTHQQGLPPGVENVIQVDAECDE